jgi:hypothetical protein
MALHNGGRCRMRSALPTEVPPNFMTTKLMEILARIAGM